MAFAYFNDSADLLPSHFSSFIYSSAGTPCDHKGWGRRGHAPTGDARRGAAGSALPPPLLGAARRPRRQWGLVQTALVSSFGKRFCWCERKQLLAGSRRRTEGVGRVVGFFFIWSVQVLHCGRICKLFLLVWIFFLILPETVKFPELRKT